MRVACPFLGTFAKDPFLFWAVHSLESGLEVGKQRNEAALSVLTFSLPDPDDVLLGSASKRADVGALVPGLPDEWPNKGALQVCCLDRQ